MLVLGVDPGISGGLSCIFPEGRVETAVMPTFSKAEAKVWGSRIDFHRVVQILKEWLKAGGKAHAYIERSQAMPKQGVVSVFNYGVTFGGLLCVFQALRIPYTLVRPHVWKKVLLGAGNTEGKASAIALVKELYPTVNLRRTARCSTDHDGMADAVCVATYGRDRLAEQ